MSGTADGPSATDTTLLGPGSVNNSQIAIDHQDEFWRKTAVWADTPAKDFLSYRWSVGRVSQTIVS